MQAAVWSDYLCPWAYLGRQRTALLESWDIDVTRLPYELHPEIPREGREVKPTYWNRFLVMAEEEGVAFVAPTHVPNTRLALASAELVRRNWPEAFDALDRSLWEAHWVRGDDIGDPDVVSGLVSAAGAPADEVASAAVDGTGFAVLKEMRDAALDVDVTGTPSWLIDGRAMVPGFQAVELFERVVTRLRERPAPTD